MAIQVQWLFPWEIIADDKTLFAAPPKIKREVSSDNQNYLSDDTLNKTFNPYRTNTLSDGHDEVSEESFVEEVENFVNYVWSDMYCLATMVVLMTLFGCFFAHHADLRQRMVGARMRIACCSLIYRKVTPYHFKTSNQLEEKILSDASFIEKIV